MQFVFPLPLAALSMAGASLQGEAPPAASRPSSASATSLAP
jgi:hypothetical protein